MNDIVKSTQVALLTMEGEFTLDATASLEVEIPSSVNEIPIGQTVIPLVNAKSYGPKVLSKVNIDTGNTRCVESDVGVVKGQLSLTLNYEPGCKSSTFGDKITNAVVGSLVASCGTAVALVIIIGLYCKRKYRKKRPFYIVPDLTQVATPLQMKYPKEESV